MFPAHRSKRDLRFASNDAPVKGLSIGLIPKVEATFGSDARIVHPLGSAPWLRLRRPMPQQKPPAALTRMSAFRPSRRKPCRPAPLAGDHLRGALHPALTAGPAAPGRNHREPPRDDRQRSRRRGRHEDPAPKKPAPPTRRRSPRPRAAPRPWPRRPAPSCPPRATPSARRSRPTSTSASPRPRPRSRPRRPRP